MMVMLSLRTWLLVLIVASAIAHPRFNKEKRRMKKMGIAFSMLFPSVDRCCLFQINR